MSDEVGVTIPTIAGLAVGVALIVAFASFAKPAFTMSDDEVRQKVRNLPEVQAFYERYTPLEQIRHQGTTTYVEYQIGKTWYFSNDPTALQDDVTKSLRLYVKVDPYGKTSVALDCMSMSGGNSLPATIEMIKTTSCIEQPEQDAY
ncbi:hypothetical protein Ngar_c27920 [Candidatus Nitrososphaera gargensis Ga9.2]|uniref:Uncharacterized protein n=1 Tax=Nitrososphaera gargensis (strain Ga9.2) TaxID=1237085 RepID=K0IKE8_NITGG|nr:hypothetical protein [Candidatus Nitrososphaera gargensis]AFU59713.1 hypothetical protein Ngar_c27920 [Candidatus Nitrososphaera gargensis Ga9.2]